MLETTVIAVVDDDPSVLASLSRLLRVSGYEVETFASPYEFQNRPEEPPPACLILDVTMPGMSGIELQRWIQDRTRTLPVVFLSGTTHIPHSVRALRQGAIDFLTKPVSAVDLLAAVDSAIQHHRRLTDEHNRKKGLQARLETLTPREREVALLVASGRLNKVIAGDLGISEATVKIHRGRVMEKLKVGSVPDLVRLLEALDLPDKRSTRAATV